MAEQDYDFRAEGKKGDVMAQGLRDVGEYAQVRDIDKNTAAQNEMQMEILRRNYPKVYAEIMDPDYKKKKKNNKD